MGLQEIGKISMAELALSYLDFQYQEASQNDQARVSRHATNTLQEWNHLPEHVQSLQTPSMPVTTNWNPPWQILHVIFLNVAWAELRQGNVDPHVMTDPTWWPPFYIQNRKLSTFLPTPAIK
jgi:hypothetical protein